MKKIVLIFLVLSIIISLTACIKTKQKNVGCEEIIMSYEDAGYLTVLHTHDGIKIYENEYCRMIFRDPNDINEQITIARFADEDDIKRTKKEHRYSIITFLIWERWVFNGILGDSYYETQKREMIIPLKNIINQ